MPEAFINSIIIGIIDWIIIVIIIIWLIIKKIKNKNGSELLKNKFAKYDFVNQYFQIKSREFEERIKRITHLSQDYREEISEDICINVHEWGIYEGNGGFCINWVDTYHLKKLSNSECKAMAYLIAENVIADIKKDLPLVDTHVKPVLSVEPQFDDSSVGELRIVYKAKNSLYIKPRSW